MWVTGFPKKVGVYKIKDGPNNEWWSKWNGDFWHSYCKNRDEAERERNRGEVQNKTWWTEKLQRGKILLCG